MLVKKVIGGDLDSDSEREMFYLFMFNVRQTMPRAVFMNQLVQRSFRCFPETHHYFKTCKDLFLMVMDEFTIIPTAHNMTESWELMPRGQKNADLEKRIVSLKKGMKYAPRHEVYDSEIVLAKMIAAVRTG